MFGTLFLGSILRDEMPQYIPKDISQRRRVVVSYIIIYLQDSRFKIIYLI
jgi:hypothetical protein